MCKLGAEGKWGIDMKAGAQSVTQERVRWRQHSPISSLLAAAWGLGSLALTNENLPD